MGETDPFVCLRRQCAVRPGRPDTPWGVAPGDRVGVAHSYLTPGAQWHTIWRTLANPGE
ncbi:hypothetical protein GCM10010378_04710 [Streptomyces viridochromogenes]